ncbi:MAG: DUF4167 domain-containing protein [Rhodobacteraceae bacterium]|jgi:hypothetical protein|nr:DUF4167 domain-containing protein [Paracoccaceae bacterium]MBL4558095.1 DUF4167 domain-containing protein [Paracoccaceae bacterium]HBG97698.1 DUF4167 domain-containing protein [Paracoccaceae bacterium]
MRSPKSRSRAKGNRRPHGNVINRVFDSSGPEGKVRGTPQQIIDKYTSLARDAQLGNDRVAAENFQQHAEHYIRLLAEAMREQEARRERHEAQQGGRGEQNAEDGGERAQHAEPAEDQDEPQTQSQPPSKPRRRSNGRGGAQAGGEVVDLGGSGDGGLVETPETGGSEAPPLRADTGS